MRIPKLLFWLGLLAVLFTVATALSSSLQLAQGIMADTNLHILLRLAICSLSVLIIAIFTQLHFKNVYLGVLVQYLVSMGAVFGIVYVMGYFVELSKNAYRDIWLNYSVIFVIVAGTILFFERRKARRNWTNAS